MTVGCDVGCDDVSNKRKKRYTVEGTRAAHSATCIKYKYQTSNVQRATLTLIKQFRLFFINLRELLDYLPSSPSRCLFPGSSLSLWGCWGRCHLFRSSTLLAQCDLRCRMPAIVDLV